jgi:hypothetical protein
MSDSGNSYEYLQPGGLNGGLNIRIRGYIKL